MIVPVVAIGTIVDGNQRLTLSYRNLGYCATVNGCHRYTVNSGASTVDNGGSALRVYRWYDETKRKRNWGNQ